MVKISSLSLFVINRIVYRAYVLGILQEKLSILLGKRSTYVNNIRSEKNDAVFSAVDYTLIATTLNWDTHDLLPPDNFPYSDGELVDKVVFSLSNPINSEEVLLGMKDNKYFDSPHTLEEIYNHLYLPNTEAMSKKRHVIKHSLSKLVNEDILKFNNNSYSI